MGRGGARGGAPWWCRGGARGGAVWCPWWCPWGARGGARVSVVVYSRSRHGDPAAQLGRPEVARSEFPDGLSLTQLIEPITSSREQRLRNKLDKIDQAKGQRERSSDNTTHGPPVDFSCWVKNITKYRCLFCVKRPQLLDTIWRRWRRQACSTTFLSRGSKEEIPSISQISSTSPK